MASRIVALTEAVKDSINASEVADLPVAERVQVSRYDTNKATGFQVDVLVGEDRSLEPQTRGSWTDLPSVDVQVYRAVPTGSPRGAAAGNAEGDRVIALAEGIVDWLTEQNEFAGFRLVGVQFVPMLDRDALREFACSVSTISLTFSSL